MTRITRNISIMVLVCGVWVGVSEICIANDRLELRHVSVSLPGAPSVVLSTDLNHDGIRDLVVAVAYTEWDQIDFEESSEMKGVEGLVMVMTVIPALMDRRELWVFPGTEGGGYSNQIPPLPLDLSVLTIDYGPESFPVIALTDHGVSSLELAQDALKLSLEPLLSTKPIMARSGTLIPNLGFSHDLNDDQQRDLLIPTDEGFEIYIAQSGGTYFKTEETVLLPGGRTQTNKRNVSRFYPMPVIRDVNGDGQLDFLVPDRRSGWDDFSLLANLGEGRFSAPLKPVEKPGPSTTSAMEEVPEGETVVHFGDLDGDGIAEYLTEESLEDLDAGWRKEVKEAKRPPRRYRVYRSESDFRRASEVTSRFEATGYAFDLEDSDIRLPGGFKDLNGDGRQDLITMTLDFSLFQAFRVLTTQRISVGLDFFVWCQDVDGQFKSVPELDLSGKFRINLKNLQLGQLSQFAGDFDGDGRIDFLQVGRGRNVTIHRGREECRYPSDPDLTIRLREAPLDLGLVQVRDLDGDDLSDLMITQPQDPTDPGVSAPVRLDLYLSGDPQ